MLYRIIQYLDLLYLLVKVSIGSVVTTMLECVVTLTFSIAMHYLRDA